MEIFIPLTNMFVSLPNSDGEALTPNTMVFGGEPFGRELGLG